MNARGLLSTPSDEGRETSPAAGQPPNGRSGPTAPPIGEGGGAVLELLVFPEHQDLDVFGHRLLEELARWMS